MKAFRVFLHGNHLIYSPGSFGKALLEKKSLNHSTKMKMYRKSFGISAEKYAEPFTGIVAAAYFQVCEIFLKMSSPIHLIKYQRLLLI